MKISPEMQQTIDVVLTKLEPNTYVNHGRLDFTHTLASIGEVLPHARPDVLDAWITALKSGDFAQGNGCLVKNAPDNGGKRYCCLGVLGAVVVRNELLPPDSMDYERVLDALSPIVEHGFLHDASILGSAEGLDIQTKFAKLNDEYHLSFDQIALVIEGMR